MVLAPRDLKALRSERVLRITWGDGRVADLRFKYLRGECGCAGCVDEITGERILDVTTIPEDLGLESMQLVGNYAVRVHWSDGHATGLYTWERLRELTG